MTTAPWPGASPYGALDMAGNVWEWVEDWYASDYYRADYGAPDYSPNSNPHGPVTGSGRVARGGSWGNYARNVRSADRNYASPDFRSYYLGFRCVRTAP